eukprot:824220-Rhodomonas_salina.3
MESGDTQPPPPKKKTHQHTPNLSTSHPIPHASDDAEGAGSACTRRTLRGVRRMKGGWVPVCFGCYQSLCTAVIGPAQLVPSGDIHNQYSALHCKPKSEPLVEYLAGSPASSARASDFVGGRDDVVQHVMRVLPPTIRCLSTSLVPCAASVPHSYHKLSQYRTRTIRCLSTALVPYAVSVPHLYHKLPQYRTPTIRCLTTALLPYAASLPHAYNTLPQYRTRTIRCVSTALVPYAASVPHSYDKLSQYCTRTMRCLSTALVPYAVSVPHLYHTLSQYRTRTISCLSTALPPYAIPRHALPHYRTRTIRDLNTGDCIQGGCDSVVLHLA